MTKTSYTIDHSDVPIRLFKSDFLEFFTHISPLVVLVIWAPVVGYFIYRSLVTLAAPAVYWMTPLGFLGGVFLWTLTEYLLHRFLFHFHPKNASAALERIIFLFHGVHHAQPQLKTRLVMPPVVSIPLALALYGVFWLVFSALGILAWLPAVFAGAIAGYIAYDMLHYATHHFPMRSGAMKFLKRYHMMHHFKSENERFGVSSPLWDYVFRTV
ncbi:MAG: sterol desaturase family protein [Chloroflexota bacterium]